MTMRTHKYTKPLIAFAYAAMGLYAITCPVMGETYNLTADFSTTQNPNGVWSFRLGGNSITVPYNDSFVIGWGASLVGGFYSVKNDGSLPGVATPHDCIKGDIVTHVPSSGSNSFVWTSPRTGKVDISGRAWDDGFYADRNASWLLKYKGTVIAQRSTIYHTYRTDPSALFTNNIVSGMHLNNLPVVAGDELEFVTQKTTDYGHFMGMDMTVKFFDPLQITVQTLNQTGYWGKSVTLLVMASGGSSPLSYQWLKEGISITGATDSQLELSNLQAENAGSYTVTVKDSSGNTITSGPALLEVLPASVGIDTYAGLKIDGVVGQTYGIQATTDLGNANGWVNIANFTLTQPVQIWYDSQSTAEQQKRFYRVVVGPISIP